MHLTHIVDMRFTCCLLQFFSETPSTMTDVFDFFEDSRLREGDEMDDDNNEYARIADVSVLAIFTILLQISFLIIKNVSETSIVISSVFRV